MLLWYGVSRHWKALGMGVTTVPVIIQHVRVARVFLKHMQVVIKLFFYLCSLLHKYTHTR